MGIEKRHPSPQLGPGGYLLDVPENADFVRRLRATPSLTPLQLVRLSKAYRHSPANASLADHLLTSAMRMVAATWVGADRSHVDPAILAFWHELGSDDKGLSPQDDPTPPTYPPDDPGFPAPPQAPVDICEFKCTWWLVFLIGTGLLWEDCGKGWHVIGVCLSS